MKKCTCGYEVPDETVFCPDCGKRFEEAPVAMPAPSPVPAEEPAPSVIPTPVSSAAPTTEPVAPVPAPVPASEPTPSAPEAAFIPESGSKKKKKEKVPKQKSKKTTLIIILVSVFLALLLLIVGGIFIYSRFFGGYRVPIRKTVKLLNEQVLDENEFFSYALPKFAQKDYTDFCKQWTGINETYDAGFSSRLQNRYDEWAAVYGDDYKITYEISEAKKLSTRETRIIAALWNDFGDNLEVFDKTLEDKEFYERLLDAYEDNNKVTLTKSQRKKLVNLGTSFGKDMHRFEVDEAYEVTMRYTVTGSKDSKRTRITFNVIKVDGKWYLDLMSYMNENGLYSQNEFFLYDLATDAYNNH